MAYAAGTLAGITIDNVAQATYPDPDGGAALNVTSNTVTTTITPVPGLSIVQNGGLVQGGTANPIALGAGYTGPIAPSQKVAVLDTLTNTGNVDDLFTLSDDFDNTSGVTVKYYPFSAFPSATPTQAQIDALSTGNITQLGTEADNTKAIAHDTSNTSRFWVVYSVPATGAVQVGPVGTSLVSSSAGTFSTDPDDAGTLPAVNVIGTNSPHFDGHKTTGTTTADLQGSQNLHTFTVASGVISGRVINDKSNDATANTTEPGISGVTLTLQQLQGATYVPFIPPGATGSTTTTSTTGDYSFGNLPAGTYRVVETQPVLYTDGNEYPGTGNTSPSDNVIQVTLAANTTSSSNIFGERGTAITGTVYLNTDGTSGQVSAALEPGIAGVTLTLQDSSGNPVDLDPVTAGVQSTVTTDSSGNYSFPNLPAGNYKVVETNKSGFGEGPENSSNTSPVIALVAGTPSSANFGDTLAKISGKVYDDLDNSGTFTAGEPGINGVTVSRQDSSGAAVNNPVTGLPITATSNSSGNYTLVGVPFGTGYKLVETQPSGYTTRASNPGTGLTTAGTGSTTAGNAATNTITGIAVQAPSGTPLSSAAGLDFNFGETAVVGLDCNTIYSVNGLSSNTNYRKLQVLNTSTGVLAPAFSGTPTYDSFGIAIEPTSKRIYAISTAGTNSTMEFYEPSDGSKQTVTGNFSNGAQIRRGAFNKLGVLYALDDNGDLHTFTPTSADGKTGTFVNLGAIKDTRSLTGAVPANIGGGDIAFDGQGNLWVVNSPTGGGRLWRVNVTTLNATLIGSIRDAASAATPKVVLVPANNFGSLAFAPNAGAASATRLYVASSASGSTYSIDLTNAEATLIGTAGATQGASDFASCAFPDSPTPQANLVIKKTFFGANDKAAKVGDTVTFKLEVTNEGPDNVTLPITVTDIVPAGYNTLAVGTLTPNTNTASTPLSDKRGVEAAEFDPSVSGGEVPTELGFL